MCLLLIGVETSHQAALLGGSSGAAARCRGHTRTHTCLRRPAAYSSREVSMGMNTEASAGNVDVLRASSIAVGAAARLLQPATTTRTHGACASAGASRLSRAWAFGIGEGAAEART
jgi:hypothetical protein